MQCEGHPGASQWPELMPPPNAVTTNSLGFLMPLQARGKEGRQDLIDPKSMSLPVFLLQPNCLSFGTMRTQNLAYVELQIIEKYFYITHDLI